jgi:hypothetical protein
MFLILIPLLKVLVLMRILFSNIFFCYCFLCLIQKSFASEFQDEITYSLGMVNASYAETQSSLKGENVDLPASGSIASISGNVQWKFSPGFERSLYLAGTFPLLPNPAGSYFGIHTGVEFYFGGRMGSRMRVENSGTTLKLKSGSVFFWGFEGGIGYLAYTTESAKKTDILLDLGAFVGGNYVISDKWQLRGQGGFARGTGVQTIVTEIKILFGVTRFIGD